MNEIDATEVIERENLAVVYRIERLEPIPNKDRIELVHMKDCGYTAICEKGHQVDDLVVFVKYDTVVPNNELFDFMKEFKFRVKPKSFTVRDENNEIVNKIYSQGIVIPVAKMYEQLKEENIYDIWDIPEGTDVTTILKVKKYIPPVQGSGTSFGVMSAKGDFPTYIVDKTDEMNLASKVKALDEIKGMDVYITQKCEGSSLTVFWDDTLNELCVCSRNNQIGEHETNKFWQAVNKYTLKEKMKGTNFVIQAELCGPGVQKNKLGLTEVDMFIFNVSEKTSKRRYNLNELIDVVSELQLRMVPFLKIIINFDMSFDEIQNLADQQIYISSGELAEGIVIRPIEPFFSKVLKENWSAKIINRNYKL